MSISISTLDATFDKQSFRCGKPILDNYLHRQAGQDFKRKLCVVFVMTKGNIIMGYYTLSNSSVSNGSMPHAIRKKMPPFYEALPVTLLGRLAIDDKFKGKGLGSILLIDALKRSYQLTNTSSGAIGVVVDPLDEDAVAFYKKFGFVTLPDSGKMFLPMIDILNLEI
jgi:predicted GNAT family N-acyltransferase